MGREKTAAVKDVPAAVAADPLWRAIESYRFDDDGDEVTFAARLARENGWPPAYADAAMHEYRRFCYLAMTTDHMVVPSGEVDQVWHLHLLYSKRYWDGFCAAVLGRPFHHVPARGGLAEADRHRRLYGQTLRRYNEVFGAPAPTALWPATAERFSHPNAWRRVNTANYVVIPRLDRRNRFLLLVCIAGLAIAIATL